MNNLFDDFYLELYLRVELRTSSLPRKCSTTELIQQRKSGKRGSNPRPPAWKASALSTELFPLVPTFKWVVMDSNHRRHRQQIYSLPHLATLVTTLTFMSQCTASLSSVEPLVGFEPTTPRLQITCSGQLS